MTTPRLALSLALLAAVACAHAAAGARAASSDERTSTTRAPAPTGAPAVASAAPPNSSGAAATRDAAGALHRSAIVIDTHNDVTQRLGVEGVNLRSRLPDGQTDIPRMKEGGLDAEFLSIFVPPLLYPGEKAYAQSLAEFDAIDALVKESPATVVLARSAAEVRAAAAADKTTFLIGVEGGHSLGDGTDAELLQRLRVFYERGARYMTLTWSNSNRLGGSSGDKGRSQGLTPLGRKVVEAMNELGMMVDISHVSDATFFDAVHASKLPVLASHSSSRALADRPRNMTDEMLRAVAANGGAVCVNFGPEFLDVDWAKKMDALEATANIPSIAKEHTSDPKAAEIAIGRKIRELGASLPPVPASRVIDHIEHIARVAGVDHVCLGSDFDGVPAAPAGLEDVSKMGFITEALLERGFSESDVRKVLGENVLRVMGANERRR